MGMTSELITYLKREILNNEEEELFPKDDLLGSGLVDSMGMMKFIGFIEEHYAITIPPQDMVIENFMSVEAIANYISKVKG